MSIKKIKILKTASLFLLVGSFLTGCAKKELIIEYKTKYICTEQKIYELPDLKNLAIAEEEKDRIEKIFKLDNETIELYKKQVIENNKMCDKYRSNKILSKVMEK